MLFFGFGLRTISNVKPQLLASASQFAVWLCCDYDALVLLFFGKKIVAATSQAI
jgi:hypothetical protein